MLESNSIDKIDMTDFDIEISSDEDEDFIINSNIVGNMEGNPVSIAGNTQHHMTKGEDDKIEDTIVTEGLSLLNVLREGTSKNMVCSSIQNFIDTSLNDLQKDWRGKIYLKVHTGDYKLQKKTLYTTSERYTDTKRLTPFIFVERPTLLLVDSKAMGSKNL